MRSNGEGKVSDTSCKGAWNYFSSETLFFKSSSRDYYKTILSPLTISSNEH